MLIRRTENKQYEPHKGDLAENQRYVDAVIHKGKLPNGVSVTYSKIDTTPKSLVYITYQPDFDVPCGTLSVPVSLFQKAMEFQAQFKTAGYKVLDLQKKYPRKPENDQEGHLEAQESIKIKKMTQGSLRLGKRNHGLGNVFVTNTTATMPRTSTKEFQGHPKPKDLAG